MGKFLTKRKLKDLITNGVTVQLEGMRTLMDSLDKAEKFKVKVGVFSPKKLREIAVYHEYGTRTIPARSFLRRGYNEWAKEGTREMTEELIYEATENWSGKPFNLSKYKIRKIYNKYGEQLADYVRFIMYSGLKPKLKRATVESKTAKGYPFPSTPLIATGDLSQAVKVRIKEEG